MHSKGNNKQDEKTTHRIGVSLANKVEKGRSSQVEETLRAKAKTANLYRGGSETRS